MAVLEPLAASTNSKTRFFLEIDLSDAKFLNEFSLQCIRRF